MNGRIPPLPSAVLALVGLGAVAALFGGYWDDGWHTERGRDEFLIAPHIAIYGGVTLAGAGLALWVAVAARARGLGAALRHPPLALAGLSVAATLASGPIDNAWHVAFGRDAVIWSPPHMLGIMGTLGLASAVLIEVAMRSPRILPISVGALVLAAAGFATAEYDTDVPQFSDALYLPALAAAATFAMVIVRLAVPGRWAVTAASIAYTGFIALVAVALSGIGFPAPMLPLLAPAAAMIDWSHARRVHPALTGAGVAALLHLAYVPVRNLLTSGIELDAGDIALSVPLTWLAATAVLAAAERGPLPGRVVAGAAVMSLIVAAPVAVVEDAAAHDPGQGPDAGTVSLQALVDDDRGRLVVELPPGTCDTTSAVALVARRGGRELRRPLRRRGCTLRGEVRLPERGRWFLYAVMRRDGDTIESWIPASAGRGMDRVIEERRYAYVARSGSSSAVEFGAGALLYVAMVALALATLGLVRAAAAARPG